uniref:Biotin carboxyl carrier protein of acetyl-CoA carboxylase n=1 Tax=Sebdenia flabellata TaxID=42024 RepID=A0A1C9C9Q1_9FLOR|nr:acetyl-CoA carboxylase biotin carboxyl carrier protein [Sebdenia flabellata]AOM65095.1 acetyl-CoA carboxylase biotin carboxyl carrier protein [Sebdenia flabellata]
MKFQIKDLKKILNSIQDNHIDKIKIKSNQFELIINKKIKTNNKNHIIKKINYFNKTANNNINKLSLMPIKTNPIKNRNNNKIVKTESETYSTIVSPMVGTFYRSPAPNEPAFIEKYDIVQKKQTVCIIEAMKLMNEIEAEVDGEIVEILVKDGDIVDCGQALMKVKNI